MALHGRGGRHRDLLGALEGEVARHSKGQIGEIAGTGAACADAVDREDSVNGGELVDELAACLNACFRGGCIGEGVDGSSCESPTHAKDNAREEDGGDRIGELQGPNMPMLAGKGCGEADENGEGGPDVGGEVDRIRLERFAVVLECDAVEVARASIVDCD